VGGTEPVADGQNRFSLCKACAVRQGTDETRFEIVSSISCLICGGLTSKVSAIGRRVLRGAGKYQFDTFSVGMILPRGVQEREDQLRSELRIRGRMTVKSDLAGAIVDFIAREMHKKVDRLRPQLTALVNLDSDTVEMMARSIFVYGRYTKPRGIPQRRTLCDRCEGRGCDECDAGYTKTPSVEKAIAGRFLELLRSPKAKFTWLGSEDSDSIVFSPGRPFIMEVKSPMRHDFPRRMVLRTGRGAITVTHLRTLSSKPTSIPSFTFMTRAFIECEVPVKPSRNQLRSMKESLVQYRNNKGKMVYKKVHRLRILSTRGKRLTVEIKLEGGLPVKRLINGDSVSPSLSELLGTSLTCQRFDILKVWESRGFEFGQV